MKAEIVSAYREKPKYNQDLMSKNGRTDDISWENLQDKLAEKSGLAIVLADENSSALIQSNNNSMCRALYNSHEFAPECAKFCGRAAEMTKEANGTAEYKCYAGLTCKAVPISDNLTAIIGRVFLKAEDYRKATERAISGDWKNFAPTAFFENVLLSGSPKTLENLQRRLEKLSDEERESLGKFAQGEKSLEENQAEEISKLVESFHKTSETVTIAVSESEQSSEDAEEIAAWRSLFGSLVNLSYRQAFQAILQFLTKQYALEDLAWLERKDNKLETIFAVGGLKNQNLKISIAADNKHLLAAAKNNSALELREKKNDTVANDSQKICLFPIAVGDSIGNALIVGDELSNGNKKKQIARFCHSVASQIEILRLREELSRRGLVERAVLRFNEHLKNIDAEDFWTRLAQISAELLRAERCSILIFDEKNEEFSVKAAIGRQAEFIKNLKENIGDRVAKAVLSEAKAVLVEDVNKIALRAAPEDWGYKTASFISYPILAGTRRIGVLNVTDRIGESVYSPHDLELLNAIVPSLGVLIDRVTLKNQAGELEQRAVTDSLTGLLNRGYLEERLTEEIKRSNRYGYPMSFLMIDVDYFKPYNDNFGHAAGDTALKMVANCLRETLRGADVAARYGGEEFSILLPQTTPDEAQTIAERVREKVEKTEFPHRKVTVSIGIASCSHVISTPKDIISAADKALYEAKAKGRNNVQIYEKLTESK